MAMIKQSQVYIPMLLPTVRLVDGQCVIQRLDMVDSVHHWKRTANITWNIICYQFSKIMYEN